MLYIVTFFIQKFLIFVFYFFENKKTLNKLVKFFCKVVLKKLPFVYSFEQVNNNFLLFKKVFYVF